MDLSAWTFVGMVGGMAGIVSFLLLRTRLMARHNRRPQRDGWSRGRGALAAYSASLLMLGLGVGGEMASWLSRAWEPGWLGGFVPLSSKPDAGVAPRTRSGNTPWHSIVPPVPLHDSMASPSVPPDETDAAPPPVPTPWAVRVGVFRQSGNVDGVVAALRRDGFTPLAVRRLDRRGLPVYYVYAGAYATPARAAEVARALEARGTDALVVEIDPSDTDDAA